MVCIIPVRLVIDLLCFEGLIDVLIRLGVDHSLVVVVVRVIRKLCILLYFQIGVLALTNTLVVSS